MPTKNTDALIKAARRDVTNFRAMVRRPNNWSGALEGGYGRAYAAVLRVEDAHGIDAAAPLSDRLTALRQESGLSATEVVAAERRALARVDAERDAKSAKRVANFVNSFGASS